MKQKTIKISTTVFLFLGFLLFGCSCNVEEPDELVQYSVFDSLQGVWSWNSTYDAKDGIIENDFEATIHFLSMNIDSTINYETYKYDSLKKRGKLKISETDWGRRRKIEPDILLHYNVTNEYYFKLLTKDSLELSENCNDCPIYYYIKKQP